MTTTSPDETTHLLSGRPTDGKDGRAAAWLRRAFSVENRILLAGFLVTLSFSFTQVPYVASRLDT